MHTITIIGAGFSGVMTAAQLVRLGYSRHGRIVIVNRSGRMARGVAFGTWNSGHLLNVPAGRLSAFDDDPDSFLDFAKTLVPAADSGSFLPRTHYGAYLERVLDDAAERAGPGRFERIVGDAVALELVDDGAVVRLSDGRVLHSSHVVLALGNYPPADPFPVAPGVVDAGYIRDPWAPRAWEDLPDGPALLVGTGLTMFDVFLTLKQVGHTGAVTALSRRGLLPHAHREHHAPPASIGTSLRAGVASSAREYLRRVRADCADAEQAGADWRDVVGSLRATTPDLWQALPDVERRRFLRHLAPFWDVHRHRAAPEIHGPIAESIRSGGLQVLAARIERVEPASGGLEVRYRLRGASSTRVSVFRTVINCTGPATRLDRIADPLLRQLRQDGLIRADAIRIGIETTPDLRPVGTQGPSRALRYIGPFLKASWWEATAVPELRVLAARLARELIAEAQSSA